MKWSDLSKAIGRAAPLLGSALGGPVGGAVGAVISSALGVDNTPDAVAAAIKADPSIAIKLREIESQNEASLRDYNLKITQAELADVQSARSMQMSALSQEDKFSKRFIYFLAAALILLACTYTGVITFIEIPKENVRFADTSLGFVLGSLLAPVISFFYGTSVGSRNKSSEQATVINKLIDKQ